MDALSNDKLPVYACTTYTTKPNLVESSNDLLDEDAEEDLKELVSMRANEVESDGRRLRYLPVVGITYDVDVVDDDDDDDDTKKKATNWLDDLIPKGIAPDGTRRKDVVLQEYHAHRPATLSDLVSETNVDVDVGLTLLQKDFYDSYNTDVDRNVYSTFAGVHVRNNPVVTLSDNPIILNAKPFVAFHVNDLKTLDDTSRLVIRTVKGDALTEDVVAAFTDGGLKTLPKKSDADRIKLTSVSRESSVISDDIASVTDWSARLSFDERKLETLTRVNFKCRDKERPDPLFSGCVLYREKMVGELNDSAHVVCQHATSEIVPGTSRITTKTPYGEVECQIWNEHYDGTMLRCVDPTWLLTAFRKIKKSVLVFHDAMICGDVADFWGKGGLLTKAHESVKEINDNQSWASRVLSQDPTLRRFSESPEFDVSSYNKSMRSEDKYVALARSAFCSGIRLGEYAVHSVIKGETSDVSNLPTGKIDLAIFDVVLENCMRERTISGVFENIKQKATVPDYYANVIDIFRNQQKSGRLHRKDRFEFQKFEKRTENIALSLLCGKSSMRWLTHCYAKTELFYPLAQDTNALKFINTHDGDYSDVTPEFVTDIGVAMKQAKRVRNTVFNVSDSEKTSSFVLVLVFLKTLFHRTLIREILNVSLNRPNKSVSNAYVVLRALNECYEDDGFPYSSVSLALYELAKYAENNNELSVVTDWIVSNISGVGGTTIDNAPTSINKSVKAVLVSLQEIKKYVKTTIELRIDNILLENESNDATTDTIYTSFFSDVRTFADRLCSERKVVETFVLPNTGKKISDKSIRLWNFRASHETYPQTGCVAMDVASGSHNDVKCPISLMRVIRSLRNAVDGAFNFDCGPEKVFSDLSMYFGNGQTLLAMCKQKRMDKTTLESTLSTKTKQRLTGITRYEGYGCEAFVSRPSRWRPYAVLTPEDRDAHAHEWMTTPGLDDLFNPKTLCVISDKSKAIMYDGNVNFEPSSAYASEFTSKHENKEAMASVFEALSVRTKRVELYPFPMIPNAFVGNAAYELTSKYNAVKKALVLAESLYANGVTVFTFDQSFGDRFKTTDGKEAGMSPAWDNDGDRSQRNALSAVEIVKRLYLDKCVLKGALAALTRLDARLFDAHQNDHALKNEINPKDEEYYEIYAQKNTVSLEWHEGTTFLGDATKLCDADLVLDDKVISNAFGKYTVSLFAVRKYPAFDACVSKETFGDVARFEAFAKSDGFNGGLGGNLGLDDLAASKEIINYAQASVHGYKLDKRKRMENAAYEREFKLSDEALFVDSVLPCDSPYGTAYTPISEYKCALDCDVPHPNEETDAYVSSSNTAETYNYSELCEKSFKRLSFRAGSDLVSVFKVVTVVVSRKYKDDNVSETIGYEGDRVYFKNTSKEYYDNGKVSFGTAFCETFGFLSERFYCDDDWFEAVGTTTSSKIPKNQRKDEMDKYTVLSDVVNVVDMPKVILYKCRDVQEVLKRHKKSGGIRFDALCATLTLERLRNGPSPQSLRRRRRTNDGDEDEDLDEIDEVSDDIRYRRSIKHLKHAVEYTEGIYKLFKEAHELANKQKTRRCGALIRHFDTLDALTRSFLLFYTKNKNERLKAVFSDHFTTPVNVSMFGPVDPNSLIAENTRKTSWCTCAVNLGNASFRDSVLRSIAIRTYDNLAFDFSKNALTSDSHRKNTLSGLFWEHRRLNVSEKSAVDPRAFLYETEALTMDVESDIGGMTLDQRTRISKHAYLALARVIYALSKDRRATEAPAKTAMLLFFGNLLDRLNETVTVSIVSSGRLKDEVSGLLIKAKVVEDDDDKSPRFPITFDNRFNVAQMRFFYDDESTLYAKLSRKNTFYDSPYGVVYSDALFDERINDSPIVSGADRAYFRDALARAKRQASYCDVVFSNTPDRTTSALIEDLVERTAKPMLNRLMFAYEKHARRNKKRSKRTCEGACFELYPAVALLNTVVEALTELLDVINAYEPEDDGRKRYGKNEYDPLLLFTDVLNGKFKMVNHDASSEPSPHTPGGKVYYDGRLLDKKTVCLLCLSGAFDCLVSVDAKQDRESPDVTVSRKESVISGRYRGLRWVGIYPDDYMVRPWDNVSADDFLTSYVERLKDTYEEVLHCLHDCYGTVSNDAYELSIATHPSGFALGERDGGDVPKNVANYLSRRRSQFERRLSKKSHVLDDRGMVLTDLDYERNVASHRESTDLICDAYTFAEWRALFGYLATQDVGKRYNALGRTTFLANATPSVLRVFDTLFNTAFSKGGVDDGVGSRSSFCHPREFWMVEDIARAVARSLKLIVRYEVNIDDSKNDSVDKLSVETFEGYDFDAPECFKTLLRIVEKKYFGGLSDLPHLFFSNHNWKLVFDAFGRTPSVYEKYFDARCLCEWIMRGEYTVSKYWHKAYALDASKKRLTIDTLVANNMFVIERYAYPLFKELKTTKLEKYHDPNLLKHYVDDLFGVIKMLHLQLLNNVYSSIKDI